jgi:hypothetical protein
MGGLAGECWKDPHPSLGDRHGDLHALLLLLLRLHEALLVAHVLLRHCWHALPAPVRPIPALQVRLQHNCSSAVRMQVLQ